MSTIRDGLRRPTTVFEAAVWHHAIKVQCTRCPNVAVFEAAAVWWRLQRRSMDVQLREVHQAFYCFECSRLLRQRVRPSCVELVRDTPTRHLQLPDDRAWKRALSRFKT